MKRLFRRKTLLAAAFAASLALPACTYDPYAMSSSGGVYSSYGSGYGDGYGYGSSQFNTSLFVGTGNPRWGYDPYCQSYFDYHRNCYYDPYLYGYYPRGYRPPVVVGCPHPYGWRPGRGYCPPPSVVRNVTVVNYRNRESAYRSSRYDWAKQVRQSPVYSSRGEDSHPPRRGYQRPDTDSRPSFQPGRAPRPDNSFRPSSPYQNRSNRQDNSFRPGGGGGRQQATPPQRPNVREQRGGRVPQSYNTPVIKQQGRPAAAQPQRQQGRVEQAGRHTPAPPRGRQEERAAPEPRNSGRSEESRPIRGLGQGG